MVEWLDYLAMPLVLDGERFEYHTPYLGYVFLFWRAFQRTLTQSCRGLVRLDFRPGRYWGDLESEWVRVASGGVFFQYMAC